MHPRAHKREKRKSRRRFSEREVIETLILQGVEITCFRCWSPIDSAKEVEREHMLEWGLGGADKPDNCAYSHKECHSKVTNGTKATSAGSSKHRIAKVKRIIRTGKFKVEKPLTLRDAFALAGALELRCNPPKPKRKWPKGQKIKSRGFQRKSA